MNLEQVVPPLELCKLIPKGEFENTLYIWDKTPYMAFVDGVNEQGEFISSIEKMIPKEYSLRIRYDEKYIKDMTFNHSIIFDYYPAPTLQEILAELKGFEMFGNTKRYYVAKGYLKVTEKNMVDCALGLWFKYKGKI